ncbi:hypothetical protein [Finegoldia magna]|uniref:Uncharacterized protein n=1 Tax=Finegoldia magna (strain ATCC 29328 / DSM 20472 / WAL 2508) TaxID=334413 RepID=B0S4J3_FINM2|nr:hypothetical protein [Finegoldia magna]UEA71135.1 hypothetical protein LK415_09410 [Finegoldia magna]BAG09184.1 hypothetical protein FMG_P0135 [Finegoldia magna ATCC 29328]
MTKRFQVTLNEEQEKILKEHHKNVKNIIPSFTKYLQYRLANPIIFKVNIGSSKSIKNDEIIDSFEFSELLNNTNEIKNEIKNFYSKKLEESNLSKEDYLEIKKEVIEKLDNLEEELVSEFKTANKNILKIKKKIFETYKLPSDFKK